MHGSLMYKFSQVYTNNKTLIFKETSFSPMRQPQWELKEILNNRHERMKKERERDRKEVK